MKTYSFVYKNTPAELWLLYLYHIYGSIAGMSNTLLVVTSVLLLIVKWAVLSKGMLLLLCSVCILIVIIQPGILWIRAKKMRLEQTSLVFDEKGIYATIAQEEDFIPWIKIRRISRKPTMIIIYTNTKYGYVLTKKRIGKEYDEFYHFVLSHMNS